MLPETSKSDSISYGAILSSFVVSKMLVTHKRKMWPTSWVGNSAHVQKIIPIKPFTTDKVHFRVR